MAYREAPQIDRLLWASAGIIAVVALISLTLIPFWPTGQSAKPARSIADRTEFDSLAARESRPTVADPLTQQVDEKLAAAATALDAGHLLEPQGDNAWSLYRSALELAPDAEEAAAGLALVADRLVERAGDASADLQKRSAIVETILETLPDHAGALALRAGSATEMRIASINTPDVEQPNSRMSADVAPEADAPNDDRSSSVAVDPIPEIFARFEQAVANDRLTAPADDNAKEHLRVMRALNPNHDQTADAEAALFDALMASFEQSFSETDVNAAEYWLDEAEILAGESPRIDRGREELMDFIAAAGNAGMISTSQLTRIDYVPPVYPPELLEDEVEGWVELEFTLTREGHARDVTVTNASHETAFTNEAAYAVMLWRFEPYTILGKTVEQRVQARVPFLLD
jgi:TonB family protein